jgi:hypothetical protein
MIHAFSPPFEWETPKGKFRSIMFSHGDKHAFTVSKLINNRWILLTHMFIPAGHNEYTFVNQWINQHTGYKGE